MGQILATSTDALSSQGVRAFVLNEAEKKGVNPFLIDCLVSHESQYENRPGDDGNSRGIFQISKIWHPEVSDAIAYSIPSSTDWSLNWIKKGHVNQWSTYSEYCSNIPVK